MRKILPPVPVNVTVELRCHDARAKFTDVWNLEIDGINISKIDGDRLLAQFSYTDDLVSIEENSRVVRCPDTRDQAFRVAEAKLDAVLDTLCISTRKGLYIDRLTYIVA